MSTYYFPKNTFHNNPGMDDFVQNWYGHQLDVLDSVNLQIKGGMDVVRFTCLRSFHHPFMIKLSWNEDIGKLEFRMGSGNGGFEPGELILDNIKIITRQEVEPLNELLAKYDFFNQPTTLNVLGLDGSQWIIEANVAGKFKVVDRWSPHSGVNFEIGNKLIEMSGESIDKLY